MNQKFDTLIVVTPKDYQRLASNYHRTVKNLPSDRLYFVGSEEVGELVKQSNLGEKVGFINENDIIQFDDVHQVIKERLAGRLAGKELPRGITGWYYQQFLKMQYACVCEDDYYMTWDGDTVPCKPFSMFNPEGAPYIDLKHEYNELYFTTMGTLIPGLKKFIEPSFISEHMLFNCKIMKQLIARIERNENIPGTTFFEKIINAIPVDVLTKNAFSEFETYGSFVCITNPALYKLREWHSFRYAGEFLDPDTISDSDYEWLSRDFDAASFEKGMSVRDDHKNLFDNKEYQSKLTARQMLEIAQEEFEGMKEVWT